MTIVFPRAMPASGVARQIFEPTRVDFSSPELGGRVTGITAGLPLWGGQWSLGDAIGQDLSDEWRAWFNALHGPQRPFLGREFGREYPRAYPTGFGGLTRAGGGAFDGSATSWSQSIAADGQATLTLNGLPVGLALMSGDYVSMKWTTGGLARRSLTRLIAPVTANGSGVAIASVDPPVPALTSGSAVAHLDNPDCVMKLVPGQSQITEMDRRRVAGLRIVAVEDLRP